MEARKHEKTRGKTLEKGPHRTSSAQVLDRWIEPKPRFINLVFNMFGCHYVIATSR